MERSHDLTKCFKCAKTRLPEDNSDNVESCDHYCSPCTKDRTGHFFSAACVYCIYDRQTQGFISNAPSGTIYSIYTAEIDGDGYLHWNHKASASTLEKAKALISTWPETKITWDKIHPGLNAENNWTFIGTRAEFQTKYNQEEVNSTITEYWGVVIEAQPLIV